jgi:hypothetical protein
LNYFVTIYWVDAKQDEENITSQVRARLDILKEAEGGK